MRGNWISWSCSSIYGSASGWNCFREIPSAPFVFNLVQLTPSFNPENYCSLCLYRPRAAIWKNLKETKTSTSTLCQTSNCMFHPLLELCKAVSYFPREKYGLQMKQILRIIKIGIKSGPVSCITGGNACSSAFDLPTPPLITSPHPSHQVYPPFFMIQFSSHLCTNF